MSLVGLSAASKTVNPPGKLRWLCFSGKDFCVRMFNSKTRLLISFFSGSDAPFRKFVSMILTWALVMGSMPAYSGGTDFAGEARHSSITKAAPETPGVAPFHEIVKEHELLGPGPSSLLKKRSIAAPGLMQLASLGAPVHGSNMTAVFEGVPGYSSIASNFNGTA